MANKVKRQVEKAVHTVKRVAPDKDWIETAARVGYVAKGVVYTIVGALAVDAAMSGGGSSEGSKGALREMGSQPFGQILLVLTGIGLAGYAAWRLVAAAIDPKRLGFRHKDDAKATIKRVGYVASGLANAALAVVAVRMAFTGDSGGDGDKRKQGMTADIMSEPLGRWLIGLVGLIVIGIGLYHFYRAYKANFMKRYDQDRMSRVEVTWAKRIGRVGLAARGVTFSLIGYFVLQAAIQADPDEVKGLGGAFDELLRQPYGPWLMGAVALGFVCYGVYCFSYARYRDFHRVSS